MKTIKDKIVKIKFYKKTNKTKCFGGKNVFIINVKDVRVLYKEINDGKISLLPGQYAINGLPWIVINTHEFI